MNGMGSEALRSTHRRAYGMGLALCLGTSSVVALLFLSGVIPAGSERPEGVYQQLGYFFTGWVFLSAAWVWWRSGQILREFKTLPEAQRASVLLRECLLPAVVFDFSTGLGLIYWLLVGAHAARHAWGFILLTPILFVTLVPRFDRWAKALEA